MLIILDGEEERHLAVIINPISGHKRSLKYYTQYVEPYLKVCNFKHDKIVTESETFVSEWVNSLDNDIKKYTDFVVIGGDGLFNQLINAIYNSPKRDSLIRIPIGLIPGGSTNAIACDLGGKNPAHAMVHILRGKPIDGDMMKLKFLNEKTADG